MKYNCYVGPEVGTFATQLCLQQFVFVFKSFMCQQKLVVHLIAFGGARLKRASVSDVGKDSRRVILTRPSFNYSTRISGTGDSEISMLFTKKT